MIRIIELFAGIGACSSALDRLGIEHEIVDAVEIDKYAIASFNAIHGTKFEVQDICKWDKDVGEIDLIMHGSPCQDFSVAGKQAGGDEGSGTRSSLMYETLRIVRKVRPRYVIWENVKNLVSKKHKHNFDRYIEEMEKIGYRSYWKVLNAKDYGVPQNRERVFTVSIREGCNQDFEFPKEQELKVRLKDVLEGNVEEKYYLSDVQVNRIESSNYMTNKRRIQEKEWCDTLCARDWKDPKCVPVEAMRIGGIFDTEKSTHQAGSIWDKEGLSPTLDTMQGGWRQPCVVEEPSVAKNFEYRIRKLTPRETWRLMGFTDAAFEKAKYKKETIFLEGSNEICNAKLKVAKEKQEQSNMETYVLCTTKDLLELGATSTEWLKNLNKQEQEKIQNVNFVIEKWEGQEHLGCATSTIKCIDYMGMHFILMQEKDPQVMVIIAQVKGVKGNTERYMKITTELNLNPIKLCIILTLIVQIIELKIFTSTTLKANIQGYIVSIEDYESNILLKNLNLEMDIMSERTSNTNLYKQAGNSIVVNVLEGILKNLFTKEGEK